MDAPNPTPEELAEEPTTKHLDIECSESEADVYGLHVSDQFRTNVSEVAYKIRGAEAIQGYEGPGRNDRIMITFNPAVFEGEAEVHAGKFTFDVEEVETKLVRHFDATKVKIVLSV